MLVRFSFTNFRSFAEPTALNLRAAGIKEHSDHAVEQGGGRILPMAAIFGPNASGKTNVLNALETMRDLVLASFRSERENLMAKAFGSRTEPASFEVSFIQNGDEKERIYTYAVSGADTRILEEELRVKARTGRESKIVFRRTSDSLELPGIPPDAREMLKRVLEPDVPLASAGAGLKIPVLEELRGWFMRVMAAHGDSPAEDTAEDAFIVMYLSNRADEAGRIGRYLHAFDPGIAAEDPIVIETDPGRRRPRILLKHYEAGTDEFIQVPLDREGAGTRKMVALYPFLRRILNGGDILLADELSANLHPALAANILKLFCEPERNPKHAQLIFTSHEAALLDSGGPLRRDEIWFTRKAANGMSELFRLNDRAVRNGGKARSDNNHARNYLDGTYGAAPVLEDFDLGSAHADI